jgi:heme-degrading monooxygenase HmoA
MWKVEAVEGVRGGNTRFRRMATGVARGARRMKGYQEVRKAADYKD